MSTVLRAQPYLRRAAVATDAVDSIIAAQPTIAELSFMERGERIAPYVAYVLLGVAALLALGLARRLYARYRLENIPTVTRVAADPRSLRVAAKRTST